jgi:hypothetical protein
MKHERAGVWFTLSVLFAANTMNLYAIPALGALLMVVLFAASRTVTRDAERLQRWMRESANEAPAA